MSYLRVRYDHDPANLSTIWLSVGSRGQPPSQWHAATRDTHNGRRVVLIKGDAPRGASVWLRDSSGVRDVTKQVIR